MTDPRLARTTPAPKPGIVHLGPGAFFRAFNAVFTEDAMAHTPGDWGIIAVSLKSPTARDQLAPQEGVFTSVTLAPDGPSDRVIGAICGILVAPENPGAVVDAMAAPQTRIVSLTITEKGYCHAPATGRLDLSHPDIAHDLAGGAPRSAPGFLVAALAQRHKAGQPGFTVMSCDNLPDNGALTRQIVLDFARARDPDLARWIADTVAFPATMVDRITPATIPDDIARLAKRTGYNDPACVQHEPFRQWVIEDHFPQGRPAWDAVGAHCVASVAAHETMKLRCLNGTHSTLAYLGYLAGYDTIAQTVANPAFARLCQYLWQHEILPTVPQPEGEDLTAYAAALLTRYANPAIKHRTWQIAMDGSQKLPQRILATISDNHAANRPCPGLALAVAGWMRYVGGIDEKGAPITVKDPLAELLRRTSDSAKTTADKVRALLAVEQVFDPALACNTTFQSQLISAYSDLTAHGAQNSVERFLHNIAIFQPDI
ncbi:mannitol dehydrogenase family protein [Oceaniglobus ichthyenteri]|uniref:mannitol dehydrogenase family protein n=1 Tax=Oceaniglobus ichthyenteri TaxID=2136177 RepID=UPI000D37D8CA|nr:mannitol dehydrogenase family protein [Oceaniglobus ichthyenteri]